MHNGHIIQTTDIPDYDYDGYYWYSDQKEPEVFHSRKIDKSIFSSATPFIVEAGFYAHEQQVSIQVRNIDGACYIYLFDLSTLDANLHSRRYYEGHKLNARGFYIIEAWEPVKDDFLENMETLQPAWAAFAGFTK